MTKMHGSAHPRVICALPFARPPLHAVLAAELIFEHQLYHVKLLEGREQYVVAQKPAFGSISQIIDFPLE